MLRNPNSTQENNQHTNEQLLNNQGVILVYPSFAKIFVGKSRIGKISEARLAWLCVSDKMDRRPGGGGGAGMIGESWKKRRTSVEINM